jgi:hypothetical protein
MSFRPFEANGLLSAALKGIMVSNGDVSALMLFLVIGALPIFVREFRNSARITLAYWFVIALHQGVAFTNAFFSTTLGADKDAQTFHFGALQVLQSTGWNICCDRYGNTYSFFERLLAALYWLFGPSQLLGSQLSILMFAVSCIVLVKIVDLLKLSRYRVPTLFVFGSLPSMVLLGSVTLRESYQLLFFMLVTYFGLRMVIEKKIVYVFFMIVSAWVMGQLHNGLMMYGILLITLFMVWNPHSSSGLLSMKKRHLAMLCVMLVLLTGVIYLTKAKHVNLSILSSLVDLDIWNSVKVFQQRTGSVAGRTTYNVPLDFSSFFTTVYTSFVLYLHYLFAPFPWKVSNILDVGGFMESTSRMVLIYFSVKHWYHAYGIQRRLLGLMLIIFFSMSFMWALGTTNYGTAMRHNMLSWWILAVIGVPLVVEKLRRLRLTSTVRRSSHSIEQTEKIV